MLLGEIEKEFIELVHILDISQLACDPTYVRRLHKDRNGDIVAEGHYGGASPLDPSSRGSILSRVDNAIQNLRCKIHLLCITLNSLIEARHIHGLPTADKAEHVTKIGSMFGFLLHTNAPLTEFNFDDHLIQTCPELIKAERSEARVLYALVLQLMKAQSMLFHGRYTASSIEGACCFETVLDGCVVKIDRFDPLKITEVARSIISLVDGVRDQIRSLTRDIIFPIDKSAART